MPVIFHLITPGLWQQTESREDYSPASLNTERFIHCAKFSQVLGVANTFYHEHPILMMLVIETQNLVAPLRWEAPVHPRPEKIIDVAPQETFPHLYGPLNLDAVVATIQLEKSNLGQFQWPEKFSLPAEFSVA